MRKTATTNRMTLLLGKYTQVTPIENQGFPLHHFSFAAYNEIGHRADSRDSIITDYIGVVRNIGQLREFGDSTTNRVTRRNIQIQNLSLKKNAINSNRLQPFEPNDLFLYAVTDSGMNKRWGHSASGDVKDTCKRA
ncbi:Thiamine phosphate synthase [Artemisia annua]|uniref:Thiamine phosphate synthase n=1 Tax=Artemisia annua TaxID=35608 RepID=A0A2U1KFM0_ARTAN|nr:Thiamine phosphate synthase [Artemisia annua]